MCNTLEDRKITDDQPDCYDTLIANLKNTRQKYKHSLDVQWVKEKAVGGTSVRVIITMKNAPKKCL